MRSQWVRHAARAARAARAPVAARASPSAVFQQRSLHASRSLRRDEKEEGDEREGSFARTDPSVEVEYPEEADLPPSTPVQGRGGLHFKRTLASFSLEGRVGVVTGGARGLGLVMSQAMVISGADVAIVDLNSKFQLPATGPLLTFYRGGGREASRRARGNLQKGEPGSREVSSYIHKKLDVAKQIIGFQR